MATRTPSRRRPAAPKATVLETQPPAASPRPSGLPRLQPWLAAPALSVLFSLIVLRDQLRVVPNVNDSSVHLALARWARAQLEAGRLPLDGWFPNLQLGIAEARHYQALGDVLTGALSWPLGVDLTYRVILYLLLATWPISVYIGARLLRWEPPVAAAAALVAPLLHSVTGYGFEHASYTWQGSGLYTQLFGMWLLPIVWGLGWQAVDEGRRLWAAALALTALIVFHVLMAYIGVGLLLVSVLVRPARLPERLLRGGLTLAGGIAGALWVVFPVVQDRNFNLSSQFLQHTFWTDSYGGSTVVGWLAGGQLLDSGRLAIVTALAAIGLVVAVRAARTEPRARALLGLLVGSLVVFAGRPTFGPLIGLIPGNQDLLLHRFIAGVHLACILLAGIGLAWLGEQALALLRRRLPRPPALALAAALVIAILAAPAWQIAQDDLRFSHMADLQAAAEKAQGADLQHLVNVANGLGGGRVYAGSVNDWGAKHRIGYIPLEIELLNDGAIGVGFGLRMPTLLADAEAFFNSADPAQYDLFNIRYLILPPGVRTDIPGTLIETRPEAALWKIATSGYGAVVDTTPPPLIANRFTLGKVDRQLLAAGDFRRGVFHQVAYAGAGAPAATLIGAEAPTPPGSVTSEVDRQGDHVIQVTASRTAMVVLKEAYDPHWAVTLDGTQVQPDMLAPGYPAVQVGAGTHTIRFHWEGAGWLPLLLVAGLLAGPGLLWFLQRRRPDLAGAVLAPGRVD